MGGLHTCYRGTRRGIADHKYIAASTTVILPSDCGFKPNTDSNDSKNGVFPEFIHGFYREIDSVKCGIDTGIVYKNNEFRLFSAGYGVPWKSERIPGAKKGTAIVLKTFIQDGNFTSTCSTIDGVELVRLERELSKERYQEMAKGCRFNREMVLAINPSEDKEYIAEGAEAFYKKATMKKTTLTTAQWELVALTASNSVTKTPTMDYEQPIPSCMDWLTPIVVTEGNGFIADTSTATADKRINPIR